MRVLKDVIDSLKSHQQTGLPWDTKEYQAAVDICIRAASMMYVGKLFAADANKMGDLLCYAEPEWTEKLIFLIQTGNLTQCLDDRTAIRASLGYTAKKLAEAQSQKPRSQAKGMHESRYTNDFDTLLHLRLRLTVGQRKDPKLTASYDRLGESIRHFGCLQNKDADPNLQRHYAQLMRGVVQDMPDMEF
jgi:hypothetical protein